MKFAADIIKSEAISSLINSGNFFNTHAAVANLLPLSDALTDEEVLTLAHAAVENTQIRWIAGDEDVKNFYRNILPKAVHLYPPDLEQALLDSFKLESADLFPF